MDPIELVDGLVDRAMAEQEHGERRGAMSVFICPECGGSLWQADADGPARFRCHVGHAYQGETLFAEQAEALAAALWTAVRTFREQSVLARQLAAQERRRGDPDSAARFDERAEQATSYGALILKHVLNGGG